MKITPKQNLQNFITIEHGGRRSLQIENVLDFSSNVSPLGTPRDVLNSIRKNLNIVQDYPDINSKELEKSLSQYLKIPSSNLIIGNGATEILYNFCNTFLSKKTPILIPIPTFSEYYTAASLNDCKISTFKTMNLEGDIQKFLTKIPKKGCVFICNPNNPTGVLITKKSLTKIISYSNKKSCMVFVDECFIELTPDRAESVIKLVKNYDNLFVLRSLTKSFGLAGLRIGYGITNKQIISILKKIKIPWSVNILAQNAAIKALKNKSHLHKTNLIIKTESNFLKDQISKINGFECFDSSTNFMLIKTKADSTKLQKKLLEKKILVRDCKNFQGLDNHFIRIAVKERNENKKLLNALMKL